MKKEIIENIYNEKYASLKEDISQIISKKAVSVLEHMKVHAAKKFFSLNEAGDDDKSWDQSIPKPGQKAAPVATPGGQKWNNPSDWAKDVGDQLQGKAPSRDVDSQSQRQTPTSTDSTITREPLHAPSASRSTSGDQPVRTVRTQGGDYPVYKKDSETAQSFRDAFGTARKSGAREFEWQGRKYGTALAGERRTQPTTQPATTRSSSAPAPASAPMPTPEKENPPVVARPTTPQSNPQPVPGAQDTTQSTGGSQRNPWRSADRNPSPARRPVWDRGPGSASTPQQPQQVSQAQRRQAQTDFRRGLPGSARGPHGE